jgi:hypothetical protein
MGSASRMDGIWASCLLISFFNLVAEPGQMIATVRPTGQDDVGEPDDAVLRD